MKAKDLNKRLRELREGNERIEGGNIYYIPELGDIISVYGVSYTCIEKRGRNIFTKYENGYAPARPMKIF